MRRLFRWALLPFALVAVLLTGPVFIALSGQHSIAQSYRNADRGSAGIAPAPAATPEAVVQVYGARAFNWRGYFAVHTWLATKEAGADEFIVHDMTGWGSQRARSQAGAPDRAWYGSAPTLLADVRGAQAAAAIANIREAIDRYPYSGRYLAWPGPNSNTFTAWVIREVPQLQVALPTTAIGKDYLGAALFAEAPSGTGYQVSLFGVAGVLVALREGIELNLLGLNAGLDPESLAVVWPGVGHLGLKDPWLEAPAPATTVLPSP